MSAADSPDDLPDIRLGMDDFCRLAGEVVDGSAAAVSRVDG